MRAARFDQVNKTLDVQDVPTPEPQPHDVLVRVQACGVCLSDVHLIDVTGRRPQEVAEQIHSWLGAGGAPAPPSTR